MRTRRKKEGRETKGQKRAEGRRDEGRTQTREKR